MNPRTMAVTGIERPAGAQKPRSIAAGAVGRAVMAVVTAAVAVVMAVGVAAVPVGAVVPGRNGKIAFTSGRDGNSEIYSMNPNGTAQTRLTNNPASDFQPEWAIAITARKIKSRMTQTHGQGQSQSQSRTQSQSSHSTVRVQCQDSDGGRCWDS
jgi:hypothetical protein